MPTTCHSDRVAAAGASSDRSSSLGWLVERVGVRRSKYSVVTGFVRVSNERVKRVLVRLEAIAALFALLGATYILLIRPAQLRWGATDAELRRAMPQDDIVPNPAFDRYPRHYRSRPP